MKKQILCIIALMMTFAAYAQNKTAAKAKLSPLTQQYLLHAAKEGKGSVVPGYVYKTINGNIFISAIIKVGDNIDQAAIDALGVHIGTRAGNIWTTQIPADDIWAFTQVAGIQYIALDAPTHPLLDSARRQTHADSAQAGYGLPIPYSGKDVVLGIVDAGFDFTHPMFFDTTGNKYRIKRIWQQRGTGTPPAGYSYGAELIDTNAMQAAGTDDPTLSHGSHVCGIAGGSGFGGDSTGRRFRGMAYASDLALVCILPAQNEWENTGASDIIDGINYIFNYANSVGKPAVVNLSWGGAVGPHDGSSLFSEACDNLTGAGKIFVCAAGNSGGDTIHLEKSFTSTDTVVNTFMTFDPTLGSNKMWVDVWGDTAKTFCAKVTLYDTTSAISTTGYFCLDDTTHDLYLIGSNGDTCFIDITTSTSEFNDRPRIFMTFDSRVTDKVCISLKGTEGQVDMWNEYVQYATGYNGAFKKLNYSFATDGDMNMTISDFTSTKSAIAVGAYVSKYRFVSLADGQTYYYPGAVLGHYAAFTSHGPTLTGEVAPFITAPGFAVASSVNSFDTTFIPGGDEFTSAVATYHKPANGRNYYYGMLAGTSMASPCVSGIVALMLQANPNLTPDSVKSIIRETALTDAYTGALPAEGDNIWGHGKINAYQAVKRAANTTAVVNIKGEAPECLLYPNPNRGNFTIDYISSEAAQFNIAVYDVTGKLAYATNWNVQTGYNTKSLNLSQLPTGIYFTKVSSAKGATTIKTIIQ